MKKAIGIGLALISILLLAASCGGGVSQDEYDKVSADLTAARAENQNLQTQLSTKTAELAAKDSELETLKKNSARARAEMEVLNSIFIPAMTGELSDFTGAEAFNLFLGLLDKVKAIGDAGLTDSFQAIMSSETADQAVLDFFVYLLQDILKSLE
ncbi:MAG: hypothetical protein A2Z29_10695 [Chloroflexi bacterium RBG_16_56_11]|nr:MAG: hypothetical protein A2Z29_10695 [Chloroflexi bacterium RBG_16_56_11]